MDYPFNNKSLSNLVRKLMIFDFVRVGVSENGALESGIQDISSAADVPSVVIEAYFEDGEGESSISVTSDGATIFLETESPSFKTRFEYFHTSEYAASATPSPESAEALV